MTQVYTVNAIDIPESSSTEEDCATSSDPSPGLSQSFYNAPQSPSAQEEDSYEIPSEWIQKYSYIRTLGMGAYGNVMLVKLKSKPTPPKESESNGAKFSTNEEAALSLCGASQHQPPREYSHPWEYRAVKVTRNEDVEHCGLRVSSISQSTIQELTLMQNIHGRVGENAEAVADREKHRARNPHGHHVINCEDYTSTPQRFLLVMPYANCGTLENWLQSDASDSSAPAAQCLSGQLVKALDCMHKNSYIHLDIKPENLLLFRDHNRSSGFLLRLADFGLSKYHAPFSRTFADTELVTPYFRPPEVFFAGMLTKLCDIWSAGIIFYQILTKERPFVLDPKIDFTYLYFFQLICAKIGVPTRNDLASMHVCPDKVFLDKLELVGPGLTNTGEKRNLLIERVREILLLKKWTAVQIDSACEVLRKTVVINPRLRLGSDRLLKLDFFKNVFTASRMNNEVSASGVECPESQLKAALSNLYSSDSQIAEPLKPKHYYCGIASSSPLCSSPVRSSPVTPMQSNTRAFVGTDNLSLIKNTDRLNLLSSPLNNQQSSLTQQMDSTFVSSYALSSPCAGLYSPAMRCKKSSQSVKQTSGRKSGLSLDAAPLESRPNSPHRACASSDSLQKEIEICAFVTAGPAKPSEASQKSPLPFASLTKSTLMSGLGLNASTPNRTPLGRDGLKNPLVQSLYDIESKVEGLQEDSRRAIGTGAPSLEDLPERSVRYDRQPKKRQFIELEDTDGDGASQNAENQRPLKASKNINDSRVSTVVRDFKKTRVLL